MSNRASKSSLQQETLILQKCPFLLFFFFKVAKNIWWASSAKRDGDEEGMDGLMDG